MRVLLTGHQGYLGTVMAPLLADAGHDVVGLDAAPCSPTACWGRPPPTRRGPGERSTCATSRPHTWPGSTP